MLMPVSAASWPDAHSSDNRPITWAGEGRNSGKTRPAAVTAHQTSAIAAKTEAAIAMYRLAEIRPPSAKRRRARSTRGGIHEAGIDGRAQIDVLGEDARLAGGGVHLGDHLVREVTAELRLVLGERIEDAALESRRELFRLGADRLGDDRAPTRRVGAVI